ncbi:expressed unknown protein [Ectocarpus siliculosus]|uniref:Uncharacterized protein n=1 Tax=Ectocarpus siliculosus TaxID=2880 RepID=D7FWG3_ECTSI|nr:expressed unknown protein [Ectocarpus siliculosus]|eukprot:CBJ32051.1 expressed unknown protein [Ectocarpus siliculosus]
MNDEQAAADALRSERPDEVQIGVVVLPLVLSAALVTVVVAYRCFANRLRRDRLALERQEEVEEIRAARGREEAGEGGSPHRSAAMAGLGKDQYMSAYKKLLAQA